MKEDNLGKLPPQAADIEEYILGCCFVIDGAAEKIIHILKPMNFYKEEHMIIYQAILDLIDSGSSVDLLLVSDHLRKTNQLDDVGGAFHLAEMTKPIVTDSRIIEYSFIILQKSILRNLISLAHDVSEMSFKELDLDTILSLIEVETEKIWNQVEHASGRRVSIESVADNIKADIMKAQAGEETKNSIVKSNTFVDDVITMAHREVIYLASPPGHGKTRILIQTLYSTLKTNSDVAVLWFSMEDDRSKLLRNMVSCDTHITDSDQREGKVNPESFSLIANSLEYIKFLNLEIVDEPTTIGNIRQRYKAFVKKNKDQKCFLIIDNFKISSEIENKRTENDKDIHVATQIEEIRNESSREAWSCIIVADHLNKSATNRFNKATGYRATVDDLIGSTRKLGRATQLVFINRIAAHEDIISEMEKQPPISINGKSFERTSILRKLTILENAKNRDYPQLGNLIHLYMDYGTMQWKYLKDL